MWNFPVSIEGITKVPFHYKIDRKYRTERSKNGLWFLDTAHWVGIVFMRLYNRFGRRNKTYIDGDDDDNKQLK